MARFCKKCERKLGFFEEDFDGMCKDCYDESIEEERKRLEEKKAKRIREEEEKRRLEEKKRLEEKRKLEEIKKHKEEQERLELGEKTKYISNIISKYDSFIIAVANTLEVVSIGLKEFLSSGEKLALDMITYKGGSIYTDLKQKTINWNVGMFESIISSLPLQVKLNDIENLYTLEKFKEFVFKFNDIFKIKKESIEKYDIFKFSIYKENILGNDFASIEKLLADFNEELDSFIQSANLSFNYEFAKQCEENKKLNALNFVYSLYLSLLYELLVFDQNIEIFKNDEELKIVFANLIKSQSDKDYISSKLYELCSNLYKDKLH